jgi:hypothetical protein
MTPEGAHVIEHQVLSDNGHSLFLLCPDCATIKTNFLGKPTIQPNKQNGDYIMDLTNQCHFNLLLQWKQFKFKVEGNDVFIPPDSFVKTPGLQRMQHETTRITINPQKSIRRRKTLLARSLKRILDQNRVHCNHVDRKEIEDLCTNSPSNDKSL